MNALRTAAAIVASTGIVALAVAYFFLQNRLETIRKWRPVEAQVMRAWMDQHTSGDSGNESTTYAANYELAYTVDGKSIVSQAKSGNTLSIEPAQVQRSLAKHGPGTRGTVYTNPNDPKEVRLNLGANVNTLALPLWLLLAAATLLGIGASLWLMGTPTVYW